MHFVFSVALIGSFTLVMPAAAQSVSGNELYESCTSNNQVLNGFCLGYLIGQIEGQSWGGLLLAKGLGVEMETDDYNRLANQAFQRCIPTDAPNQQLRDVVVKFLEDNPATRHETARYLVWEALRDAFPCE